MKVQGSSWRTHVRLIAAVALIVGVAAVVFPMLTQHPWLRPDRGTATCLSHLKVTGMAAVMYAQDHDHRLPPVHHWHERIAPWGYQGELQGCPEAPSAPYGGYAMRPMLTSEDLRDIAEPAEEVLFFDGRDAEVEERHEGGANYCFADGHAQWLDDPPAGLAAAEPAH